MSGGLRGLFVHRPLIQSQCRWPRDQKRFSGAPLKKYKHALAESAKMMMNRIITIIFIVNTLAKVKSFLPLCTYDFKRKLLCKLLTTSVRTFDALGLKLK